MPHSLSGGPFLVPLNKGNEGSGNKIGLNRFSDFNVASSRYFNLFTGPEPGCGAGISVISFILRIS